MGRRNKQKGGRKIETIISVKNMVSEKMAVFVDKAPGLVSLIVTLVIVAGFIG